MNEWLDIAVRAALDAGQEILKIYAKDFEIEFKADESPLTSADKAAHEIIIRALESTPYPVLSEESAEVDFAIRKQWKQYWLVDPLDGTKEFIKKNGEFTVNIALIDQGAPVMGVVFAPVLDALYYGVVDDGDEQKAWKAVTCLGKSLEEVKRSATRLEMGSQKSEIQNLKVVASKSHCSEETVTFIEQLEEQFGAGERVSMGSSLKLCLVAENRADIYPRIAPTMEWDTAAAHAVVRASGGEVYEFSPDVSAVSYLSSDGDGDSPLKALRYNKENLLNPFFVVC